MKTRMLELAERRARLLAEVDRQRVLAADAAGGVRAGLAFSDRGLAFLRTVTQKPVVVGVTATAIALLFAKPAKAIGWLSYALSIYAVIQRVRRLFSTRDPSV